MMKKMYLKVHNKPNGRHQTHVKAVFLASNGKQKRLSTDLAYVPMHHSAVKSVDSAKASDNVQW